mgnify:CR=1 FL=1
MAPIDLFVAENKPLASSSLLAKIAAAAVRAQGNGDGRFVMAVSGGSVPKMAFTDALFAEVSGYN